MRYLSLPHKQAPMHVLADISINRQDDALDYESTVCRSMITRSVGRLSNL